MAAQTKTFDWGVTPERVDQAIRAIVEATHPLQIIAFGSRARGDHRVDSDLDLAVILDTQEDLVSPFEAYLATGEIHMSLDIVVASRARFDLMRPWLNSVHNYIDKEGVVLYDRDHPERARPHALHHSGGRPGRSHSSAA
jgi:predicted nucleotidyltransferase